MAYHVLGGVKNKKKSLPLSLPTKLSRPTPHSVINRSKWLSELLKDKSKYIQIKSDQNVSLLLHQTRSGKRRNKKLHKPYKKKRHHTGKRGWKRETMYVLKDSVQIPERLDIMACAEKAMKEKFEQRFADAMSEAIASARS